MIHAPLTTEQLDDIEDMAKASFADTDLSENWDYMDVTTPPIVLSMVAELKALRVNTRKLNWIINQFKVLGTDGCTSCDPGRVTLYRANAQCMECDPRGYDTYEERFPEEQK